jgi:hypothetical protein
MEPLQSLPHDFDTRDSGADCFAPERPYEPYHERQFCHRHSIETNVSFSCISSRPLLGSSAANFLSVTVVLPVRYSRLFLRFWRSRVAICGLYESLPFNVWSGVRKGSSRVEHHLASSSAGWRFRRAVGPGLDQTRLFGARVTVASRPVYNDCALCLA